MRFHCHAWRGSEAPLVLMSICFLDVQSPDGNMPGEHQRRANQVEIWHDPPEQNMLCHDVNQKEIENDVLAKHDSGDPEKTHVCVQATRVIVLGMPPKDVKDTIGADQE